MSNLANAPLQPCRPYTRWERGIMDESAIITPLVGELVELGFEPLYPKRLSTATISVVTAHQFNQAVRDCGDDFSSAKLASDFLSSTGKGPTQPLSAPVKKVIILPSYGRRSENISKVALALDCPTIQNELSTANVLLGQEPYESDIHISFMNIATPQTGRVRKKLLARLADIIPEELLVEPVMQKTVTADGTTTFRDLRSLRHEYRVERFKQQLLSLRLGKQFLPPFYSRPT